MAKSKSFRGSETFMTDPEPQPVKWEDPETTEEEADAPTKRKRERKTERLQLLVPPSIKRSLEAKSEEEDRSINDICNEAIKRYLSGE